MAVLTKLLAALAIALALLGPAASREVTDEQYAALETTIEEFDAAMKAGDIATVVEVVPPKVMEAIAAQFNISTEDLLAAMIEQTELAMQAVTIVSFGMDLEAAEWAVLDDGSDYALIPTETVVDLGDAGGKISSKSMTLALLDEEVWYLVRIDDAQQVTILKQVYPAFADVEFPAGTTEAVTE